MPGSRVLHALILGLAPAIAGPAPGAELPTDLELVLAVDVSHSIDAKEARLQREGYLVALVHPRVIDAIQSGPLGRIAVTYIEWADSHYQTTVVDWMLIDDAASARAFATALATAPRHSANWTSISAAIDYAAKQFDVNDFDGTRRVIDVSGDSANNSGPPMAAARNRAVAAGITINGLPILNERLTRFGWPPEADVDVYYERFVVGGPGAFVIVAKDFNAFASAIQSKLIMEIAGTTGRAALWACTGDGKRYHNPPRPGHRRTWCRSREKHMGLELSSQLFDGKAAVAHLLPQAEPLGTHSR